MYVDLQCTSCGSKSRVSFGLLCEIWAKGYKAMDKKYRSQAKAVTNVKCHCGHNERYSGPMFTYIFQLVFDDLVKEEEV